MQGDKGTRNDNAPDENGVIDEDKLGVASGFDQAHQGMPLVTGADERNGLDHQKLHGNGFAFGGKVIQGDEETPDKQDEETKSHSQAKIHKLDDAGMVFYALHLTGPHHFPGEDANGVRQGKQHHADHLEHHGADAHGRGGGRAHAADYAALDGHIQGPDHLARNDRRAVFAKVL